MRDVGTGRVRAGRYIRQICKRQLSELMNGKAGYTYSEQHAERVCIFIELLRHIKGTNWRNQTIKLMPWQAFALTTLFGWVNEDGFRRFRTAYIQVARKNTKSTLASGLALYCLLEDSEYGPEIYIAGVKSDQSHIVYNMIRGMIRISPALRTHYEITDGNENRIQSGDLLGSIVPLAHKPESIDGFNPSLAILDELHAHPSNAMRQVLRTGMGARQQGLLFQITTAGRDRSSVCYQEREYGIAVLRGEVQDDSFFPLIYELDDPDKEWDRPESWIKANPSLGVSVFQNDMQTNFREAANKPMDKNDFLQKRLNVWVSGASRWIEMAEWDKCRQQIRLEDCAGCDAYLGIDLASKIDLAALAILIPDISNGVINSMKIFCRHYLPRESLRRAANAERYEAWAAQDDSPLILTDGEAIDHAFIERDIKALAETIPVQEIGFDPWNATQFATNMAYHGFRMIEVRQGARSLSEPMKMMQAMIREKRIIHNGDPALAWQVSNLCAAIDANDNVRPIKEAPENKIDAVVAALTGFSRVLPVAEGDGDDVFVRL